MRGEYAAIHSAIVDDRDFKALSPAAKCCFYTLRMMLGASGIDLVRASVPVLEDLTGLKGEGLHAALNELVAGRWLIVQGDVLWLRNALLHNPNINLDNANHRKGVAKHIAGLPACEIVNAFAVYYGFSTPFPAMPSEWVSNGYGDPVTGHRSPDTHTGGTTTTQAPSARIGVENSTEGGEDYESGPEVSSADVGSGEAADSRPRREGRDSPQGTVPEASSVSPDVESPAYSQSELLEMAEKLLGLGIVDHKRQGTNKGILNRWMYGRPPRDTTEIACAIEGAAMMRDADLIGWSSARPGMPMTLAALNGPMTLADQGDGKAVRDLYSVAVEYRRARDLTPRTAKPRTRGSSMDRLHVNLGGAA